MKVKVFITETKSSQYDGLLSPIKEIFDQFGGIDSIIQGKIFIKLNLTTINPQAITNPEVVLALITVLKEGGIDPKRIFVFDNSAAGMPTRVVFKMNKLNKRIKKLGANIINLDEEESILLDFNGKALDKPIPFPKILYTNLIEKKGENTYINVPKLKTHLQAGVTICIKNQHGLLYDEQKLYNHHLIDEKIVDIYKMIRPDFNIVDATSVIDNGAVPFSPEWNKTMNLLLAGRDGVAVDTIGAKLLGVPLENVRYLKMVSDQGLGTNDMESIEVYPDMDIIERNKMQLNDDYEKIVADFPENFRIIYGEEYAGCRAGCRSLLEYYKLICIGAKMNKITGICGRGHNLSKLDKLSGPIFVVGPCAIEELKDYFDTRAEKNNQEVYYIEGHFDMVGLMRPFLKISKIPLSQMTIMMKIKPISLLSGYIGAKLHKAKFIGIG